MFARFLLLPILGLLSFSAQAQDSTLTRLIRRNRWPLVQDGAHFTGIGWDRLQREASQSQFVLLGETHGTAQVPQFAAALAQVFRPALFVTEIDRYQAQDLTQLTSKSAPPTAFLTRYPMALSFFSWPAEFALAQQLQTQHVPILGVDQLNFFAAGRFYDRLADQVKNKQSRTYLRQRATAYQAHDRATMRTDLGQLTMMRQSQAALDSLVAVTNQESPAVRQQVQEYLTSAHIYQTATKPGGGSHQQRTGLLKHNLLLALRPYQPTGGEALPKILAKFGATHLMRNLSFNGVFDVGSLFDNLADAQQQRTLHVMVFGKQGTMVANGHYDPTGSPQNVEAYPAETDAISQLLYEQANGSTWNLIDLRPARRALLRHQLQVSEPTLENMILGYDYVVVIPQTTASIE